LPQTQQQPSGGTILAQLRTHNAPKERGIAPWSLGCSVHSRSSNSKQVPPLMSLKRVDQFPHTVTRLNCYLQCKYKLNDRRPTLLLSGPPEVVSHCHLAYYSLSVSLSKQHVDSTMTPETGPIPGYPLRPSPSRGIAQQAHLQRPTNGTTLQGLYDSLSRIRQYRQSHVGGLTKQTLTNVSHNIVATI
jgi:hypothetical protein